MISDEEFKQIAKDCGDGSAIRAQHSFSTEQLQAFAREIERISRQQQRESDAALFQNDPSMENFTFVAEAILANKEQP